MLRQFETARHAKLYAQFRPQPPTSLINHVVQYMRAPRDQAVDVGCGSGQNTRLLAPHFSSVLGIDISPAQIAEAVARNTDDTVQYRVSAAEEIPVADNSVQLVTAATCYHFFDKPRFLAEVDRVLAPGGVVALFCHCYPYTHLEDGSTWPEVDEVVRRVREVYTAEHWIMNFEETISVYREAKKLTEYPDVVWDDSTHYQERPLSVDAFIGEMSSWSGFQNLVTSCGDEKGEALLQQIRGELLAAIADGERRGINSAAATTRHPYELFIARKPGSSLPSGQ